MSESAMSPAVAGHKKFVAARNSLIATVLLVAAKLTVGVMTGSLGVLAEAIHSGLDLIVSFLTLFAVRFSTRPPDADHPYGHGKIENLTAFIQCVVLLVTCGWIVYEAVHRLLTDSVDVTVSIWAYGVIIGSIVIDVTRSRVLRKVAKETNSQALAADALNFETDIFSSVTVLIGLALVTASDVTGIGWLARGDAVAALIVAGLIAWLSVRLLRETLNALLDGAHVPLTEEVREVVAAIPGVLSVRRVRARTSGAVTFIDLVVTSSRLAQFDATHDLSERIEQAVLARLPNADVLVHLEPEAVPNETVAESVQYFARRLGGRAHEIELRETGPDRIEVDLHFEADRALSLADAHAQADRLEADIVAAHRHVRAVNIHLEPLHDERQRQADVTADQSELARRIANVADTVSGVGSCHEVRVYQSRHGHGFDAVVHVSLPGDYSIDQAHDRTEEVERALKRTIGALRAVLIHAEPIERAKQ